MRPGAVRLADDSVFARARDEMLHLARVYPVDRLLAVFRANAGIDTRGARAPGTWEDFGHPEERAWNEHDYPGRENAPTASLLRGHYAGHFLSMLSLAAASTGDPALRRRVDEFVAGLAEVQDALAAIGRYSHPGFLAAYGEWQFSRLEEFAPYGEIWAPYYTCHKIMAGLIDAHELTGNEQARAVVTRMGHWVHGRLSRLDRARRQKMWSLYIAGEFGGMNESMARLATIADEPLFLETAAFFEQDSLLEAGAAGRDILTDRHANQHLPQLLGYVHQYQATGDDRYLRAVVGLWNLVVPGRMYAHGGTGESELWGPAGAVAGDIGHRNAETCATHNLIKIARRLFQHTRDPRYPEYVERALLNHILGSRRNARSDESPEVTYMFPVHPGALREYDNVGTCCGGTGLENHVGYQEALVLEGPEELWIAQLFPAHVDWASAGLTLTIRSGYPLSGEIAIVVTATSDAVAAVRTIHVRIPGWVVGDVPIAVNGADIAVAEQGGFIGLTRAWGDGDEIRFSLPIVLRSEATVDDPGLHALFLGPTLLLTVDESRTPLRMPLWGARDWRGALTCPATPSPDGVLALGGRTLEPCWSGSESRYHMYVRADDETIAFGGIGTDVPNRRRADGSTFLATLWAAGGFSRREEFLDAVLATALGLRREGLLTRGELERVLRAAAGGDAVVRAGDRPGWRWDGGFVVWILPDDGDIGVPPSAAIECDLEPAPSGWFTAEPTIRLRAVALDGASIVECSWRTDGGEWSTATQELRLGEGSHDVEARVVDDRGLVGFARRTFSVDTAAPASRAVVRNLGASVEVTLDAQDDVSGVECIRWRGERTFWGTFQEAFVRALTDEEQVIEFAAVDRAGNEEALQRLVLPRREPR
ncbi:MAG TPA: glycoside hydrolase family 127 protein [Arachnia sp.]|nr:glycoside hydrolase family 127 protein [Arachnia sp.]HMT86542.1 glycoside hydrolase family 127 protein [Arachnia sp.]